MASMTATQALARPFTAAVRPSQPHSCKFVVRAQQQQKAELKGVPALMKCVMCCCCWWWWHGAGEGESPVLGLDDLW